MKVNGLVAISTGVLEAGQSVPIIAPGQPN
jgi:hypothetical protein